MREREADKEFAVEILRPTSIDLIMIILCLSYHHIRRTCTAVDGFGQQIEVVIANVEILQ